MTHLYKISIHITVLIIVLCGNLSAQNILFTENFENGNFNPIWKLSTGQPNGVVEVVATKGLAGEYAARLGKSSDGKPTLNRLDLPIDLSSSGMIFLELMVSQNHDENQVQDGVFLSVDGGSSFTKIYDFTFQDWPARKSGNLPPINLSALARSEGLTLSANCIIRFQQYGKDDFKGSADFSDGIYLDNITVSSVNITHARLPFSENFEAGEIALPLLMGDPGLSDSSGVLSNTYVLDIAIYAADSSRGKVLRMGSRYDKSPATNALDMYLDLSGEKNIRLTMDFLDNRDETSPADGILFSDNGGFSFTKVMSFDTDNWSDDIFGTLPQLNVDHLAELHGLKLNNQFVIRFQQHGSNDFEGSRLSSDGIMIDNISVFSVETSYAQLPFLETFDDPNLSGYWQTAAPHYPDMSVSISPHGTVMPVTMENGRTAVRLGNTVDRCYTTNVLDLYVDMAGHPNAELSFTFIDNYDETHEQDGIFFSQDGGRSFKKVFDFDGEAWTDKEEGSFNALSVQRLAKAKNISLTSEFVIRFQQHDNDDFEGTRTISDGIYLDDIRIEEPGHKYADIPFSDSFEDHSLSDFWGFGYPMLSAKIENIKPAGSVSIMDSVGNGQSKALALGRASDGKITTNHVDLHLALAGEKDLSLNFWLHNNYNEVDDEDGIWLSKNGGYSFVKAWSYPMAVGSTSQCTIDLDSLVYASGLSYTDQFVIRFQQSDDRRFDGRGTMKGGLFIDDLLITHALDAPIVSRQIKQDASADSHIYALQWQRVANSTSYRAQLIASKGNDRVLVKDTTLNAHHISFKGLSEDSTYFFRLQAKGNLALGSWSKLLMFRTYRMSDTNLQISGTVREEHKVVLQASQLSSCQYQWYKDGKKLKYMNSYQLEVQSPGSYSVHIENSYTDAMSPSLKVTSGMLGYEDEVEVNKSAIGSYGNR